MKRAIKSVGKWIMNVENNRNLQMRSDFDEEKEYKLEKQREIQSHIEELSNYYEGENKITYFNEKIRQHKELYLKYTEMKESIEAKIRALKDIIPDLEKKIFLYKIQLKNINKENLKLMGQINHFENEISNKLEEDLENIYYNIDNRLNDSTSLNNSSLIGNSINVQEILEKNENLKKKKEKIDELKEILKEKKNENDYLIKNINMLNNNYFRCRKIYREGMYEIAKELLRINEIELDKVINNSNTNFNSLYFDIFKTNYNNGKTNKDFLKIPIINSNIKTKFKYPVAEKAQPNDLLYKVVKNIINENNVANKINNIKKNKFSWDEFKDFSAYQVYTLLNLNKKNLDELDNYIFNYNSMLEE
jgi:chromosome segregation ATPase